ncbi:ABC transporter permease [Sphingomonas sp. RB3P16]|uniref:ABC transporter permease n=1 Tax=Parasphingomonas frigoris TaxID=3096163 RepID=UPI002FC92EF8
MSAFGRALSAELAYLRRSRWDLAMLTVMPALLLFVMGAMLFGGVARDLPIAVVDHDGTSASRTILRAVDASPAVRVVAVGDDLRAALTLVRREQAWAILEIPRGVGSGLARGTAPALHIRYQASFLSTGTQALRGISGATSAASAELTSAQLSAHALPIPRVTPLTVQVTALYNAPTSFEWYLLALVDPAVLHLLTACVTVMALGRELRGKSLSAWARESGGVLPALVGKLLPYVAAMTLWGAIWLLYLTLARGWRVEGSIALIMLGQGLLYAGTAAISALLVAVTRETATGLSASAVYGGSALAFSGATLPLDGGSLFARFISAALPLTHYIALQMGQFSGDLVGSAVPSLAALLAYSIVAGGIAVLAIRRGAGGAA